MKVLIADFDLFHTVGGGQTYYRSLIGRNPNIDYSYFRISEPADATRPANAHALPHTETVRRAIIDRLADTRLRAQTREYVNAANVAASAADQAFDLVEVPDYHQFGGLLAAALREYQVPVERIVVSLHGRMSRAIELNQDWRFEGPDINVAEMAALEQGQYAAADVRYGISRPYLREWQAHSSLPIYYLNPLHFFQVPTPQPSRHLPRRPEVCFVGRFEKWKGPDLFVNLVWWLPPGTYETARLIGAQDSPASQAWTARLEELCRDRLLPIQIQSAMSRAELEALFAADTVTLLPSRWDTLNFVALESLLAGCPTGISKAAGASEFLRENFPTVPFIVLDVGNLRANQPAIADLLDHYSAHRDRLFEALQGCRPQPAGPNIAEIYQASPQPDVTARTQFDQLYADCRKLYASEAGRLKNRGRAALRALIPQPVRQQWRALRTAPTGPHKNKLSDAVSGQNLADLLRKFRKLAQAQRAAKRDDHAPIDSLIQSAYRLARVRVGRSAVWGRLADLEQKRGREVVACAYWLRMFRSQGGASPKSLARVVDLLAANGYAAEASAANAMYAPGDASQRLQRSLAYLEQARLTHQTFAAKEFEFVDDHRGQAVFRVAVIVSLYAAAAKLGTFLNTLRLQSEAAAGRLEIVLVDSGSPEDEYRVFKELGGNLPVVYARSVHRETIQTAWNRGIQLARAPYLAFLGADEGVVPACLDRLAAELDRDSSVDWVQSNSVVTNVDPRGAFLGDVMTYDRRGYEQDLAYLETCYLSWVGALYRRSIHDRFGYYDGSFQAAGDTEFKNRVLPFIKTKFVPMALGVFWNYPEERTTAHPRAELEDLRAWYLHRSPAGIRYAFGRRDTEAVAQLMLHALHYRKSFARHGSSDVEYAVHLGAFLWERQPSANVLRLVPGAEELLRAYRRLDAHTNWTAQSALAALTRARASAALVQRQHQDLIPGFRPVYRVSNDNRYEQHAMLWGLEGELDPG